MYEAKERLYLTADRKRVVPEGSPEAAFLWATPGKQISEKEASMVNWKPDGPKQNKTREAKTK